MNSPKGKQQNTRRNEKPGKKTKKKKRHPQKLDPDQTSQPSPSITLPIMAKPAVGEPGISERRGIRWIPGEMQEPTSTLVLTSSRKQFVDLRILCQPGQPLPNEGGPSQFLDWGIAGESSSTTINAPSLDHPSNPPPPADGSPWQISHSIFSHWIDDRTDTPGPDQGDMYDQPDGTTLELGSMYNPLTDSEQPYEEVWADHSASPVEGKRWSVVIDLDDPEHRAKGRVVRVGEHCQGILKVNGHVTVERWKYVFEDHEGKGAWRRLARLGDFFLPVSLAFKPEIVTEGNTVSFGEYKWAIREVYSW